MTMRIRGLERRLLPIGKIRLGDQVVAKNGKKRPHVLERVRLTSSNAFLLQEASKLYGGHVTPWQDAPAGPNQWELYVEVDAIPILIPPIDSLMQCYEVWSAKGCLRRCDNATIQYAYDPKEIGTPCACPVDLEERQALAADGQACKLTTRISCMLPDLPGIGLWVIETHSYYASLWTAGMVELLEGMAKQGRVCEALLKIERQSRKTRHGVRNFAIPVILPQTMTPRQLFAPEMYEALHPGEGQKMLPDERQKSLPEHIGDLCGDGNGDSVLFPLNPLWADMERWYAEAGRPEQYTELCTWACKRYHVVALHAIAGQDVEALAQRVQTTLAPLIASRQRGHRDEEDHFPGETSGAGDAISAHGDTSLSEADFAWQTLERHKDNADLPIDLVERIQAALSPLARATDAEARTLASEVLEVLDSPLPDDTE